MFDLKAGIDTDFAPRNATLAECKYQFPLSVQLQVNNRLSMRTMTTNVAGTIIAENLLYATLDVQTVIADGDG